ncbi:hypothetical protein GOP47_0023513 [Adiantum capillus-veneris]|uniref:Conserved oligomeric Golgi complex subunit 4 n=1 Tax=Adiantum capillus-veneris TaxID=13818 RepID=A0A9D4U4S4_ADICA|nr:hypothetical protein GOP47_0023513 [Adiantum capillus-veneris]
MASLATRTVTTIAGSPRHHLQQQQQQQQQEVIGVSPSPAVDQASLHFAPGMLDQIRALTDAGAMTRLLHETVAFQRAIESDLETLFTQRHDLERKLAALLLRSGEVLEIVKADSDQMLSSVASTCALADHVSGKVRELDHAQSRVQSTLARIDAIVERANCIDGAKQALDSLDFESAAKFIETFLHLDAQYSDSTTTDDGRQQTSSEQRTQLLEYKEQLEKLIRQNLASAVDEGDHQRVVRFVKLFTPLALEEEGLRTFVAYLRKVIVSRAREEFDSLVDAVEQAMSGGKSRPTPEFVGALRSLFADIAVAVQENEEILRFLCNEDGIVHAVKELQEECDSRVGAAEGADPREIESAGAQMSPRITNFLRMGTFNRTVQELTMHYIVLEEYFMAENVRKAIKIDEFVTDALTTSMVDDVFYVLQECTRRAISTLNLQSVLATVNSAVNLLNNEYNESLRAKLREPNLAAKLFSAGVGVVKVGTEVATALNNVDISAEYVIKLRHDLEEHCTETFAAPADRDKAKSCLTDLGETGNTFRQLLSLGLEQLANSVTPKLRPILDSVGTISYELTEAQYAENEVNNPWVQKLLYAVDTNVTWLQPMMTTNTYDSLVHLIIDFIVKRLEVIITQKRFNQLGGLQLDRDARNLVSHFSSMTQRTVRDKFARLSQMATILNLEKVSEILDYWGENSGPMTWRLTPAEARRILGLRIDFKPEAIQALRL